MLTRKFGYSANALGCGRLNRRIAPRRDAHHIAGMATQDPRSPDAPRVERPRVEPEIIPPGGRGNSRGGFDSLFVRVEEGPDGIRRVYVKKPGSLTIVLVLLAAGLAVAILFLLLSALVLLWIPLVIAGIAFAMFSGSARNAWLRARSWLGLRR